MNGYLYKISGICYCSIPFHSQLVDGYLLNWFHNPLIGQHMYFKKDFPEYNRLYMINDFINTAYQKLKNRYAQNIINILASFNFYQSCTCTEFRVKLYCKVSTTIPNSHLQFLTSEMLPFSTLQTDSWYLMVYIHRAYLYFYFSIF